jgi:hypothetical protein
MPITVRHEGGNICRVEIRGTLRSREFTQGQHALATEMSRLGAVRILVVLDAFEGWDMHDDWRDLSFFVTRGDDVERIAIVGQERWKSSALMFAAADLRKAPVEFFNDDCLVSARAWLAA